MDNCAPGSAACHGVFLFRQAKRSNEPIVMEIHSNRRKDRDCFTIGDSKRSNRRLI